MWKKIKATPSKSKARNETKQDAMMKGEEVLIPAMHLGATGVVTEIITSVAAMQLRAGLLFSEMIQGMIAGYRVEIDRSAYPTKFHITTWR